MTRGLLRRTGTAVAAIGALAAAGGCSSKLALIRASEANDAAIDRAIDRADRSAVDAAIETRPDGTAVDAAAGMRPVADMLGPPFSLPLGAACTEGNACASGHCVESVCCDTACAGGCESCARTATVGTCAAIPLGVAAHLGACPVTGVATCGLDGTCDGVGGCHLYPAGALCAAPGCLDGATFQPPSVCDGQGACKAASPLTCSPYTCVNGACYVDDCKFQPADCVATPNRDASPG